MKTLRPSQHRQLRGLLAALTLATSQLAFGQTAPAAAAPKDDPVALPQFTVTETSANRYQSRQALSASRIAMDIQDIPQTISVVPHEFIQDSMATRRLDAAKYVTPIVGNTLPYGGDRYTIRGFQVSTEFIDGTQISGTDGYSMSNSTSNIERLEIIKDPTPSSSPAAAPAA